MKLTERINIPLTIEDVDGKAHEIKQVAYVLERTCHDKLAVWEPFECSECYRRTNDTKFPNYCWYCGARVVSA